MTTSLAQQLKKLRVPQTTLLLQDNRRASLLFDPKEAATLDRDTVHAIGITGLEELQLLDPTFCKFSRTIFEPSSKNLERSVLTSAVNQNLNASISQFLRILSPYFLLRPAHKALEWLVYRFHIHLYNVDELLSCVIPFHESRIFVRVLQLLDVSDPASRWHWLLPLQKPGVSLPKSTLITHCCKDLSFLKFICDLVPHYMEAKGSESACQALVGFYTVTVLGVLEQSSRVTEETLQGLLPYLLRGLKCQCPDYRAATYMLLSQIAVRTTLSSDITQKLLTKMAQHMQEDLSKEFVICTLVIFQHQQVTEIPKGLLVLLRRRPHLQGQLEEMSSEFQIAQLLGPILRQLVVAVLRLTLSDGKVKSSSRLLKRILSGITLDPQLVTKLVSLLLKMYLKQQKTAKSKKKLKRFKDLRNTTLFILGLLERKYPLICDKATESFLNSCKDHQGTLLQSLLSTSSRLPERRLVKGTSTPLFLALHHPSHGHRRAAVLALKTAVIKGKLQADSEFAREAMIDRLKDDHPKVVRAVLHENKVLFTVCPKDEVFEILLKLLDTSYSSKWTDVKENAIFLLCNEMDILSKNDLILSAVLPFLFPVSTSNLKYAGIILGSELAKTHPLLKHLATECKEGFTHLNDSGENTLTWAECLIASLKRIPARVIESLYSFAEVLSAQEGAAARFILFEFLQQLLLHEINSEQSLSLAQITLSVAKKVIPSTVVTGESAGDTLDVLRKEQLPLRCVTACIEALFRSLPQNNDDGYSNLKMDIFDFLSTNYKGELAKPISDLLNTFFKRQFESSEAALTFLSVSWTEHLRQDLSSEVPRLQLRSLLAAQSMLTRPELVQFLLKRESLELTSLMLSLMCPEAAIRRAALDVLHSIVAAGSHESAEPPFLLAHYLGQRSDEILADESQFQQILESFLSPALDDSTGKIGGPEAAVLQGLLALCLRQAVPSQVQYGILLALQHCQGEKVLSGLLPVCNQLLNQWEPIGLLEPLPFLSLTHVFSKMTAKTAFAFSGLQAEASVILERVLTSKASSVGGLPLQDVALKVLSRKFFVAIPCEKVKQRLLDVLLSLYVQSRDGDKGPLVFKTLRKVCGDSRVLLGQLKSMEISTDTSKSVTMKDIRLLRSGAGAAALNDDKVKEVAWAKVKVLLEVFLANKEDPSSSQLLLGPVFSLLQSILESWNEDETESEGRDYELQLVLSCLHRIVISPSASQIEQETFHVDLVVQCVRLSRHPQAQRQALLLLNAAALLFPERVLQSVMAVFTFMGSSLLRKEDNFSFQVVVETVDTIVPALLKATDGCQKDSSLESICAGVTRVFVDAVYDIPSQRRLPVFHRLVSALGTRGSLWLPLVQLIGLSVIKPAPLYHPKDQEKSGSPGPAVQFALSLCGEFSPAVQVNACLRVIQFIAALPKSKESVDKDIQSSTQQLSQQLVDLKLYSERQLQHLKHSAVTFVGSLLSSQEFLSKVVEVKPKHSPKLESGYKNMLECLLRYIQDVANAQQGESPILAKFWKALLHKLYDLVDKVTSLLPASQFLSVVKALSSHQLASVRRKALEMLNAKLLNQPKFFDPEEDHPLLISLLKRLMKMAKGGKRSSKSSEMDPDSEERIWNQQTALFTLELLTRMLAESHPAPFTKILGNVCHLLQKTCRKNNPQLSSSAWLCLAELCGCLRAHALPHLAAFMPPLLVLLHDHTTLESNDLLLLSSVMTVHRLVEHLPAFLSSYLVPLLMQICYLSSHHLSTSSETGEKTQKTQSSLQQKLIAIHSQLATAIPARVLLPAAVQCYQQMEQDQHTSIGPLMSILKERISSMEKADFTAHLPAMKTFFLAALDFRHKQSKNLTPQVNEIEGHIMEATITLTLKLSETSFRPLFYQLYEWATREDEDAKERIITFYRLTDSLASKLKSLFVLFANHFVKNAADVLNANNIAKSAELPWGMSHHGRAQSSCVLRYLLLTLHSCFLHDSQRTLVDSDCFQTLSQPLLDQLENTLGEEGEYQLHVSQLLGPCLAQLAVAAADDASWKPFHYQLLLKARHADAKIRFAALEVLQELASKLGDDYVTLLPEAIPFLAELMEDESFEVEQQCQAVVAKMEQVVGEPLMKYF